MADLLTLPGTIPGLLRRGSPGRHDKRPCIVLDTGDAGAWCARLLPQYGTNPDTWWCEFRHLSLDLTDATGRAHAAWWLGGRAAGGARHDADGRREIPSVEEMHPLFRMSVGFVPGAPCLATVQPHRFGGAAIRLDQGGPARSEGGAHRYCHIDHSLDLDPNDSRLLPDGSRWVDAEALRRVILHVAKVTP